MSATIDISGVLDHWHKNRLGVSVEGSEYFIGKQIEVLHDALSPPAKPATVEP